MSLDNKQVEKIAKLSRIKISEEEAEKYTGELNKIFDWIEQLQEVNTDGVEEMAGVGGYTLRNRADEVQGDNIRAQVLANAPESAYDCYVVPKVVE